MDPLELLRQLAISVLLGSLVGLQRERVRADLAGFRTFPLITTFGTMCGILAAHYEFEWMVVAGVLGVFGLMLIGNIPKWKQEKLKSGVTTEAAMLVMYLVGVFVVVGPWLVAMTVTGGVAILLQMKPQLHELAEQMGEQDFKAILQFVLITFIILPVLPNRNYDPFQPLQLLFPEVEFPEFYVLNPYEVWLMVVLVVGISLGGYVSYKFFGERAGTILGGVLGGTISSTATTVSYSRRTARNPEASILAAIAIMIATSMAYVRVLLEIAIAGPALLPVAARPILLLLAFSVVLSALTWYTGREQQDEMPRQENPSEILPAVLFALMYAVVLIAVAVGERYLRDEGLYAIAALSGMTSIDAITLSTARLVQSAQLDAEIGWRLVVIAALSNLVFKGGIVAMLGNRQLKKYITLLFGLSVLAGLGILLFWR